jgi:hypothetical protein
MCIQRMGPAVLQHEPSWNRHPSRTCNGVSLFRSSIHPSLSGSLGAQPTYQAPFTCVRFLPPFTKVKVQLSLCWTKHHAMKAHWGSGGIAPRILDLGTRWRWVVNFTLRPLYSQGKSPQYPLDRRLGRPQSRSGHGGEEKNSQPPPRIES